MKKLTVLNKSIITALCVALCVVLPMALHAIPKGGVLFSPMHLPVLLCGLVCGAPFGLICGVLGPFVSSILTSMPAFGYMPDRVRTLWSDQRSGHAVSPQRQAGR